MARRSVLRRAETAAARAAYVEAVLALYRSAPGTLGHVRKADVRLARGLYDRGVALRVIEDAITVALCRRLVRTAAPLEPVRSLHYFLPVIDEVLAATLEPDYVVYLRGCLARHLARSTPDP
jgi:hypothetical protein